MRGARTNNLRDVSVDIAKGRITVFTGVSGSGKSSLVFGTIAAESQRLLNETAPAFVQALLPRAPRPDVDALRHLSAAIIVDQKRLGVDARSTVGTATDTYELMRQLWSRVGVPHAGPPSRFSFNDAQGMCPTCEGTGSTAAVDLDALLDRDRSLNEGALLFPTFAVDSNFWSIVVNSGFFDPDVPLRKYTQEQWHQLLDQSETKTGKGKTGTGKTGATYEGVLTKLRRLYLTKDPASLQPHVRAAVQHIATTSTCPDCAGSRLSAAARSSLIDGRSIADCAALQVDELLDVVHSLQLPGLEAIRQALLDGLGAMVDLGLGYLSLDRRSGSLSGGESQRVRMVRHLGSALTDLTYVFDEPTTGLHPHDVERVHALLVALRDQGNTVLVVEHDPQVIALADAVVDLGPGAGRDGGHIVYTGTVAGLRTCGTLTGQSLSTRQTPRQVRTPTGWLRVEQASLHNLRQITVDVPLGVLTAVTGVAGSGKSSLARSCLPRAQPDVVVIDQDLPRGSRRSNPATYTGLLEPLRKAFAKANGVPPALFSANSTGACATCSGLGVVSTDLSRFDTVEAPCEDCDGAGFQPSVLQHQLRGLNIAQVLALQVSAALDWAAEPPVLAPLSALRDVGLGYLTLGQPLSTLSGGERQRLKLAVEMASPATTYVIDEPTAGLHRHDVTRLLALFDQLVDSGSTVVVIEHDLDVIAHADWILDLGPGAGRDGGTVVFAGTPADLTKTKNSLTGRHLRSHLQHR